METEEDLKRKRGQLEAAIKNAELERQLQDLRGPWWRSGGVIAIMTAIIAAVVPLTAGVQGWLEARRQLELETFKLREETRTSYLEREGRPGQEERTLRFIVATSEDDKLRDWASAEEKFVKAEEDGFDVVTAQKREELREYERELATSTSGATSAVATPPPPSSAVPPPQHRPAGPPPIASGMAASRPAARVDLAERARALREELDLRDKERATFSTKDGGPMDRETVTRVLRTRDAGAGGD